VNSATQITATSPANGSGDQRNGDDPSGTSAVSAADQFTYVSFAYVANYGSNTVSPSTSPPTPCMPP